MATATQVRAGRDEAALIERVKAGDSEAFYELVKPYEKSLYIAAYSVLQNEADAQDAAQEAVLKGYLHLKSFRAESKFSTWIIQICINEARMKRRKDRKGLYESIDDAQTDEYGDVLPKDYRDWRPIPVEDVERESVRQAIARALEELSPIYREVFVLRDVQHLSIEDTAKVLRVTQATVKTRLLRARIMLRDKLAPGWGGDWYKGSESRKGKHA